MGYPKQVYQRANEELARRREAARKLTETRTGEIMAKIPEIEIIRREMAETAAAVTRAVIVSPGNAGEEIGKLRNKNLALQKKRAELLRASGYPEDYLSEQQACDKCGGGGYIGSEMCVCLHDILKNEAFSLLGSVSQVKQCGFDNFDVSMYPREPIAEGAVSPRSHMSGIFEYCKQYAAGFSLDSPSLLMLGQTGLGKTHLSLAIAASVTSSGYGVIYTPVQKLMDRLEAAKFSFAPEAKEQYARDIENTLTCDLLVLDDLGTEFITQFSSSTLYNIVNTRLVETRPTIINTNLESAKIEAKYSPRMLSRLMGGYRAHKFMGKDIRFIKKLRK